jgi:hypothetical protein
MAFAFFLFAPFYLWPAFIFFGLKSKTGAAFPILLLLILLPIAYFFDCYETIGIYVGILCLWLFIFVDM